ncbi:MAG: hypothetical protein HY877_01540 [Deltaproteobacteria bacterium]|nr:hypothetical protein [Deltaproteobacteria bacterium]
MTRIVLAAGCAADPVTPREPQPHEVLQDKGFPALKKVFEAYVDGDVQTLIPGQDGETLFVVRSRTTDQGNNESNYTTDLVGVPINRNPSPSTAEPDFPFSLSLSDDSKRFYSWGAVGPYIGVMYTGSNGLHGGVSFIDPKKGSNQVPLDCPILDADTSTPTAILAGAQIYYVLGKNDLTHSTAGALGKFDSSKLTNCQFDVLKRLPLANPAALAFAGGYLLIGDAGNPWAPQSLGNGRLLYLDPANYQIKSDVRNIPDGFALNGPAPVSGDGTVLFTGNSAEGNSLTLAGAQSDVKRVRIAKVTNQYVSGGTFVGSSRFVIYNAQNVMTDDTTQQRQKVTESYVANTQTGEPVLLQRAASFYAVPFVQVGAHTYCQGAVGAALDETGGDRTLVTCWEEISDK